MPQNNKGLGAHGENLSIMIPNYNGAKTLGETLQSVWAQNEKTEQAEICVMDNCSTDDSEAVAQREGKGRVQFFRHSENIGAVPNFNACLQRASRPWVHLLHSDDCAMPGGYNEVDRVLRENPDCDAVFGRVVYMDEQSLWSGTTVMLGTAVRGVLPYDPLMWCVCPIQFAGAFLHKDCIQATGGMHVHLNTIADWNLWWRVAKNQKPAYTNVCIGQYRVSASSGTSRGLRSGEMVGDVLNHLHELAQTLPPHEASAAYEPMFEFYLQEMPRLFDDGAAYQTNLRILQHFPQTAKRKAKLARLQMRFMRHRMQNGNTTKGNG